MTHNYPHDQGRNRPLAALGPSLPNSPTHQIPAQMALQAAEFLLAGLIRVWGMLRHTQARDEWKQARTLPLVFQGKVRIPGDAPPVYLEIPLVSQQAGKVYGPAKRSKLGGATETGNRMPNGLEHRGKKMCSLCDMFPTNSEPPHAFQSIAGRLGEGRQAGECRVESFATSLQYCLPNTVLIS